MGHFWKINGGINKNLLKTPPKKLDDYTNWLSAYLLNIFFIAVYQYLKDYCSY